MSHREVRPFLSLALLTLATACQSLIEPLDGVPVDFIFGIHRLQTEPSFVVDARAHDVVIRGYLLTPCQPYHASASADVVEKTIVLRVIGKAVGNCPQDAAMSVGYQATLHTAPSAYTHLRVVHEWRNAPWSAQPVLDTALSQ